MNILIYGHRGWIGGQVIELLSRNNNSGTKIFLGEARVENLEDVRKEILKYKPTHVMSFIGRTHGKTKDKVYETIDYLEQPGKIYENIRDNLFAPIGLSLICQDYGIHLTYVGTGCIFEFDKEHPFGEEVNGFTEEDIPNFFGSSYSIVKGFTDRLMHCLDKNTLNVRIRMPITADMHPRNFITKITKYKKICSIPNSMTVLPDLLPIMLDMARQGKTGTINLVNPGLISHNEILQMYRDIVDKEFTWANFSLEEQSEILAAGRSNNYLDTSKLQRQYPKVKCIKESIKDILIQIKKDQANNI